eukprot:TRINITY_DN3978_c0_g1_i2.p3 TRINITY_DN3978_c0_g1~~TRINITY_DN3978_c0_g1_i2.p3  ORF type:complete len:136 (-),score=21.63 TRINITY_DN3978_c0_g1_i2:227-634(-)
MSINIVLKPRIQIERWSLYWKQSMSTTTQCMDQVEVTVEKEAKLKQVVEQLAKMCNWEPVDSLLRLEGFNDPWERAIFRGRELQMESSLQENEIKDGDVLTVIRCELVAEGWRIEGDESEDEVQASTFQQFPVIA